MDIRAIKNLFMFVKGLTWDKKKDPTFVPYYPQKPVCLFPSNKAKVRVYRPESVGISRSFLDNYVKELAKSDKTHISNLLLVVKNKPILASSAQGFSLYTPHITHSLAKTFVALAIGFLYDQKKISLDETLLSLFPEYQNEILQEKKENITIEDLLKMAISVSFNEANTVMSTTWLRDYFLADIKKSSQDSFSYNSLSTYVLSAIVQKKAKKTTYEFLKENLFDRMGIVNTYWESSYENITKGGWGLYICPMDMAKIGQFLLDKGKYQGISLLSEEWIQKMCSKQISVSNDPDFDYGYQVWVSKEKNKKCILFNGMLGQNILVIPEDETVLVLNSQNNELFHSSDMMKTTFHYFCETDFRHTSEMELNHVTKKEHFRNIQHLMEKDSIHPERKKLFSRKIPRNYEPHIQTMTKNEWHFPKNNYGILPVFTALMQNTYEGGISSIRFVQEKQNFYMELKDNESTHKLEIGFYSPKQNILKIHDEQYIVSLVGKFVIKQSKPLFLLHFIFPEIAGECKWEISLTEPMTIQAKQLPDFELIKPYIDDMMSSIPRPARMLLAYFSVPELLNHLKYYFTPSFELENHDDLVDIITTENN